MARKKVRKTLRTFHEVVKSIRHPIAPPDRKSVV